MTGHNVWCHRQGLKRTGHRWGFTFGLGAVLYDLTPAAEWRFGDVGRDRLCRASTLLLPLPSL